MNEIYFYYISFLLENLEYTLVICFLDLLPNIDLALALEETLYCCVISRNETLSLVINSWEDNSDWIREKTRWGVKDFVNLTKLTQ